MMKNVLNPYSPKGNLSLVHDGWGSSSPEGFGICPANTDSPYVIPLERVPECSQLHYNIRTHTMVLLHGSPWPAGSAGSVEKLKNSALEGRPLGYRPR